VRPLFHGSISPAGLLPIPLIPRAVHRADSVPACADVDVDVDGPKLLISMLPLSLLLLLSLLPLFLTVSLSLLLISLVRLNLCCALPSTFALLCFDELHRHRRKQ